MAATVLSTTAATLPLLGYPFSYALVAPAGLTQIVLALWLIARGFAERHHAYPGEAEGVEFSGA
jgi:hypothetical protein